MKPRPRQFPLNFSLVVLAIWVVCPSLSVAHAEDGGTSAKAASFEFNPEWRKDDPAFRQSVIDYLERPRRGRIRNHEPRPPKESTLICGVGSAMGGLAGSVAAHLGAQTYLQKYPTSLRYLAIGASAALASYAGCRLAKQGYYAISVRDENQAHVREEENWPLHERIAKQISWELDTYTASLKTVFGNRYPENPKSRLENQRLSIEDRNWIRLHGPESWLRREYDRPGGYEEQVQSIREAHRDANTRIQQLRKRIESKTSPDILAKLYPEIITPRLRQMLESEQAERLAEQESIASARTKDIAERAKRATNARTSGSPAY